MFGKFGAFLYKLKIANFSEPIYYTLSGEPKTFERIVEIPFVLNNLDLSEKKRILEVGCVDSKLCLQLASLGHDVTGFDLRNYNFKHPNFSFTPSDIKDNVFVSNFFDYVISVSTIEHCGIGYYGENYSEDGDKEVVDEIYRLLKKGGKFLMTVPFGIISESESQRVYDNDSLKKLMRKFKIEKEQYFRGLDRKFWIPVERSRLNNIDSDKITQGVACIIGKK